MYPRALSAAQVASWTGGGGDVTTGALTTTWTRDERGLPTSMTDPDGTHQLRLRRGRPAHGDDRAAGDHPGLRRHPAVTAHPVTTTGYDTFGDTAETEDPDGNVTTYGYDADGRPVSETDAQLHPARRFLGDHRGRHHRLRRRTATSSPPPTA